MPEPNGLLRQTILQKRKLPGLLLFDARGRLLFLNAAAQQILHGQGHHKDKSLQKIRKSIRDLSNTRRSPPSSAASQAHPFMQTTFSSEGRPYTGRAFLLDDQPKGSPPLVAVLLEQIKPTRLDLRKAQELFRLSPRELEAVQALQKGMTDKEIASAMGISTETAKGYLKTIRAKLGVSTRTAILQKVLSL